MILSHTLGVGLESARVKGHSSGVPRSRRRHRDRHGSVVSQTRLLHARASPPQRCATVPVVCVPGVSRKTHLLLVCWLSLSPAWGWGEGGGGEGGGGRGLQDNIPRARVLEQSLASADQGAFSLASFPGPLEKLRSFSRGTLPYPEGRLCMVVVL